MIDIKISSGFTNHSCVDGVRCGHTVVSLLLCALLLRLSGLSPFQGDTNEETLKNIIDMTYEFDARHFSMTSSMAKDFIQKLLVKNPRYVV